MKKKKFLAMVQNELSSSIHKWKWPPIIWKNLLSTMHMWEIRVGSELELNLHWLTFSLDPAKLVKFKLIAIEKNEILWRENSALFRLRFFLVFHSPFFFLAYNIHHSALRLALPLTLSLTHSLLYTLLAGLVQYAT